MTRQAPDYYFFKKREFYAGFERPIRLPWIPIDLQSYGVIRPEGFIQTNCYRGYFATFDISDNRMILDGLVLPALKAPPINGVSAVPLGKHHHPYVEYRGLNVPVAFTGSILLMEREWFAEMNRFRDVYEFTFENGIVVKSIDCATELLKCGRTATLRGEPPSSRPDDPPWLDELSQKYDTSILEETDPDPNLQISSELDAYIKFIRQIWLATAPACIATLGEAAVKPASLALVRTALETACPEHVDRIRALFCWLGAVPERFFSSATPTVLLLEFSTLLLVKAATGKLPESTIAGARRLFASKEFKKRPDIALVPKFFSSDKSRL